MNPTTVARASPERAVASRFRPCSTRREVSLHVVRLPGELTGSGTTCPTPAPRPGLSDLWRLAGDSPQMLPASDSVWFPGLLATRGWTEAQRGARADLVVHCLRTPDLHRSSWDGGSSKPHWSASLIFC